MRGCTTAARRIAVCACSKLADVPPYDAELVHEGKVVGRVTSAARRPDGSVVALAYVRVEVPDDAALALA